MGFELRFTDKEITAWGGMGLMKRLLDRIIFSSALEGFGGFRTSQYAHTYCRISS